MPKVVGTEGSIESPSFLEGQQAEAQNTNNGTVKTHGEPAPNAWLLGPIPGEATPHPHHALCLVPQGQAWVRPVLAELQVGQTPAQRGWSPSRGPQVSTGPGAGGLVSWGFPCLSLNNGRLVGWPCISCIVRPAARAGSSRPWLPGEPLAGRVRMRGPSPQASPSPGHSPRLPAPAPPARLLRPPATPGPILRGSTQGVNPHP